MTRIISRNNKNKFTKKSLKLLGGKPLFRNINQTGLTTDVTLRSALGINNALGGGFIAANVTNFAIISTTTLYGYVFRINLRNNTALVNINVDNNPVNSYINELGLKICVIANNEIPYDTPIGQKCTTTLNDFRGECQAQYEIFTASSLQGANSLTPGIVHAEITSNNTSINYLVHYHNITQRAGNDPDTINTFNILLQVLRQNPRWRLGFVFMDFIPNTRAIGHAITLSAGNNLRQLCLRNMNRWALLRCAHVSTIFHRDFHLGNALYSETNAPGFFHDRRSNGQIVPVNSVIQIIDWGRSFTNHNLFTRVRQLFIDMRAHIENAANANQFTRDFVTSHQHGMLHPNFAVFNDRIYNIFRDWLAIGQCQHLNWVISLFAHEQIDSHIIMYYENRYILGRTLVNANTFATVIPSPDAHIVATLAAIN
jgi:hypothetical protein